MLRLWRMLLHLLPRDFRARHGDELVQLLGEEFASRGLLGRLTFAAGCVADLARHVARQSLRRRRQPGATAPQRGTLVDGVWQDIRFAVRAAWRRPGVSATAVLVFGIGIAATTTVFSVVNAVLLRPLPYDASDRIGILWHEFGDDAHGQSLPAVNPLDVLDYRTWSRAFDRFTFGSGATQLVAGPDTREPFVADIAFIEAGFFDFFGIRPALGRALVTEDTQPGAPGVVLLSHDVWMQHYGGRAEVLGASIDVEGRPHEVVGILPADFQLLLPIEAIFLSDADVWRPSIIDPSQSGSRTYTVYTGFGRLAAGVSFSEAQAELDAMMSRLHEEHEEHAVADTRARIVPLKDDVVGSARPGLTFVSFAASLVLLVACANVANLLLARMRGRDTEFAIRSALGAGRRRVMRLVLCESLVLAGAGGMLGVAAAYLAVVAVRLLGRESLPRLDTLAVDGNALAFSLATTAVAALAAGLLPATGVAARGASSLSAGGRASRSRAGTRFRDGLIVVEVALSVILLSAAGLMLRSFGALHQIDPGYATDNVTTYDLALPPQTVPTASAQVEVMRSLEQRLSRAHGVSHVAAVTQAPLTGTGYLQPYAYDDDTAARWESVTADRRWTTPGYFRAMGATVVAGRDFTWSDLSTTERILIVDDTLATRAFGTPAAVGRRIHLSASGPPWTIIGVVGHMRLLDLDQVGLGQIYTPMRPTGRFSGRGLVTLVVAGDARAAELTDIVGEAAKAVAPGAALGEARTMAALAARARAPARAVMMLVSVFAAMTLVLAAVGLYAVLAFWVRQRTPEIGIRLALGQKPSGVEALVFAQGVRLLAIAMGLGLLATAPVGRLLQSQLVGVRPTDPVTYVAVATVLSAAGLMASWIPARRATRIDPLRALRADQ